MGRRRGQRRGRYERVSNGSAEVEALRQLGLLGNGLQHAAVELVLLQELLARDLHRALRGQGLTPGTPELYRHGTQKSKIRQRMYAS